MAVIVTLTTDFGTRDGYVAAMKGAMLSARPGVTLVDVTHEITAQDVMEAAFVLRQVVPSFPAGSVHLAVVDPGVGTARRAIAARFEIDGRAHTFVGPDNGILPLLAGEAVREIAELDKPHAWHADPPSSTFHGRDIFGPVAARLASGATLAEVGTPAESAAAMHWPLPRIDDQGVDGMVIHVDGFGNCITNITRADLEAHRQGRAFKCYAGSTVLQSHHHTYAEVGQGDPLSLFGSSGLLEIAVNCGDAAELLSLRRGASVSVIYGIPGRDGRAATVAAHAG